VTQLQGELLEHAPLRAVVLPGSNRARCWWGVDSATRRLNVGWVSDTEVTLAEDATGWVSEDGRWRGVQAVKLGAPMENEGMRLALVRGQVSQLVRAMLAAGVPPPGVIYVEQPAGEHPKPTLYYTVGCTAAAFYEAVHEHVGWSPQVEFIPSSSWKLAACGSGNLPKTQRKPKGHKGTWRAKPLPLEEYGVMKWARVNGYSGESWDDADCLAMADAARRTIAIR
jgi:hypothetical protein